MNRTPTGTLRTWAALTVALLCTRLKAARERGDFEEVARLTGMLDKNRQAVRERIEKQHG
jgi:hypothetical protein